MTTSAAGEPEGAVAALLQRFQGGGRVALARAISLVEGERAGFRSFLHAALADGLRAHRVGLTGPPGAGKSTLVGQLAAAYRKGGDEVGIVAVDPTSPFSGGALLGDRIRMNDLATDPGIFIRSMATRGSLGGLAGKTREVIDLMDAFGFGRILVETVGVGQTELEITQAADTVVVALVPESGDSIQAMKAGLMEIADIFVINKADRPGADRLAKEIRLAIHLRAGEALKDVPAHHGVDLGQMGGRGGGDGPDAPAGWEIPVLKTVAHSGEGIDELLDAIRLHGNHLRDSNELEQRRRRRWVARVRDVVARDLSRRAWDTVGSGEILAAGLERIATGDATPYSLADEIVENLVRRAPEPPSPV